MIVALVAMKGGAAKSTLSLGIGWELRERGCQVLLVDADPQETLRGAEEDAAKNGLVAPNTIGMGAELYRPEKLPFLAKSYEHVIIDTPGRLDEVTRAALMVADVALVPTLSSGFDFRTLAPTLDLVSRAQLARPKLRSAIVLTIQKPRTTLGAQARAGLEGLGVPVFKSGTVDRSAWREANTAGQGVAQYAPNSLAAQELRALVDELLAFATPKGTKRR